VSPNAALLWIGATGVASENDLWKLGLAAAARGSCRPSTARTTSPGGAAGLIPQIERGSNREMLGQAIAHVQAHQGTAAQKADLFERLAGQINELSGGSWSAARGLGTDGSHVFVGELGEALIISPEGKLFRGSVGTGVRAVAPGKFEVDYSQLRAL
jgi:hypothetical protein